MRALIALLFLSSALAAEPLPARRFTLVVRGKFARRWMSVYKERDQWICSTESLPSLVARGNPLDALDWAALKKSAASAGCRDLVEIDDRRAGGRPKTATGCLADPAFRSLVDRLDRECRAE